MFCTRRPAFLRRYKAGVGGRGVWGGEQGRGWGGGGTQAGRFFRRSHLLTAIFITGSAEPVNSRGGRESAKRSCHGLDASGQCRK